MWIAFTCAYFGVAEVIALLEDVLRYVRPNDRFVEHAPTLLRMLRVIVDATSTIEKVDFEI